MPSGALGEGGPGFSNMPKGIMARRKDMSDIAAFFDGVAEKVDKDKIQGMSALYQFSLSGDEGGDWNVKISDGVVAVASGAADAPNITLSMADTDFSDLIAGKLNGQTAFLTGKLKIQGDMTLAMKLQSIFALG
jgi:putative sterol carrier protein